jgi:hypothetical protein
MIYRTLVAFSDSNPGKIFLCDTIEYEGQNWLVPDWITNNAIRKMRPSRLVLLDSLRHQKTAKVNAPSDFVLNDSIPKCVFDGKIPAEIAGKFHVIENPDIWVDIPSIH